MLLLWKLVLYLLFPMRIIYSFPLQSPGYSVLQGSLFYSHDCILRNIDRIDALAEVDTQMKVTVLFLSLLLAFLSEV